MKTPIHLWIVGALSLLWNIGMASNYVMIQFQNPEFRAAMSEADLAFFDAAPAWYDAVWALSVWGAVIGSLLLLFRSRLASAAFLLSLICFLAASVYSFGLANPPMSDLMGPEQFTFVGGIFIGMIVLWLYARTMTTAGVLR